MFGNYKIHIIPKLFQSFINERLKDGKLSSMYFPYIMMLSHKQGQTMVELSKNVFFDKSNTSRIINELKNLGIVTIMNNDIDKRIKKIFLTKAGEKYVQEFIVIEEEWNRLLFQGINDKDKEFLNKIIDKIMENAFMAAGKDKAFKEESDV